MTDFEEKPMSDGELKKLWNGARSLMFNRVRKEEEFEDAKRRQLETAQLIREQLFCVAEAEKEADETADQREAGMIMLRASAKMWKIMATCVWDYVEWYPMLTKHEMDDDFYREITEDEKEILSSNNGQYYRLTEFGRLFLDDDRITFEDVKRLCVQRVNDQPFDSQAILREDADAALADAQKERNREYLI